VNAAIDERIERERHLCALRRCEGRLARGRSSAPPQPLNASLAATYGDRYLDAHAALVAATPRTAQDVTDIANGVAPASLRWDALHPTQQGQRLVALKVKERLDAKGW
jgi:lysophospholipase L1-like esterase